MSDPIDIRAILKRGDYRIHDVVLPQSGEVRIVTTDGKVTSVETTVKENVE